jgi:hypothetical protein
VQIIQVTFLNALGWFLALNQLGWQAIPLLRFDHTEQVFDLGAYTVLPAISALMLMPWQPALPLTTFSLPCSSSAAGVTTE